jgi:hypothetical protein
LSIKITVNALFPEYKSVEASVNEQSVRALLLYKAKPSTQIISLLIQIKNINFVLFVFKSRNLNQDFECYLCKRNDDEHQDTFAGIRLLCSNHLD